MQIEANRAPLPWSHSRKLIARVEATSPGTDVRFIVNSLSGRGKTLYEKVFCAREPDQGHEALHALRQNRLLALTGQSVPPVPARGRLRWRRATFETIRRTFVKIAVRVEELKGRIKLVFSASYPHAAMLAVVTGAVTARGPRPLWHVPRQPFPQPPTRSQASPSIPAVNPANAARQLPSRLDPANKSG